MGAVGIRELETVKKLTDQFIDAVYIVDREFHLIHVNQAFRRMFKYRERGRSPMRCSDHLKMGICASQCVLVDCKEGSQFAQWRETTSPKLRAGVENISVCAYPLLSDDGEVAGAVTFLHDISADIHLQNANREIIDILDNIKQSIFTVTPDLAIAPQYSKHVHDVFGDVPVGGAGLAELMFPLPAQQAKRQALEDWARLAFAQPHLPWEIVAQLVDHDVEYVHPDTSQKRHLVVQYEPIRSVDAITRIMVLTEDITEKDALKAEIEKKSRENEDNLEQISELIGVDPELFDHFLREAANLVDRMRDEIRALATVSPADRRAGVDGIFRQIHTLKGNAATFKLKLIATRAHWVEDLFAGVRDGTRELTDAVVGELDEKLVELQGLVERAGALRDRVLKRPEPSRDLGRTRDKDRPVTLPIDATRLANLRRRCAELARGDAATLSAGDVMPLLAAIRSLTHVPFVKLAPRLRRILTDLSSHLDKQVAPLVIDGADGFELDAEVLNVLGDPLIHILRNSLDHGIEPTVEERVARGKPAVATVAVRVRRDVPGWVHIDVEDDGRGVDVDRVLAKAVASGLIADAERARLSFEQTIDLVFAPGFSTAEAVTDVSGRGVGMDVVRTDVTRLGGSVTMTSEPGRGSRIRLAIPEAVIKDGLPAALNSGRD